MLTVPIADFIKRRKKIAQLITQEGILIIPRARVQYRNADSEYNYRQNSDFYYLSGVQEAECILVIAPGSEHGDSLLFHRHSDEFYEIWHGRLLGREKVASDYGFNASYELSEFDNILPTLLSNRKSVHYTIGCDEEFDKKLIATVNKLRSTARRGTQFPTEFVALDHSLHEMRVIKSEAEIEMMREAGRVSAEAHCKMMKACKTELHESKLEAEFYYHIHKNNCRFAAYTPIIAGGNNATILHYVENNQPINNEDLVLVDAGGEYEYYASDITRTFPASGKFSESQKAIYEAVLKAQQATIDIVTPGLGWDKLHEISVKVITEELIKLGLLNGKLEYLIHNQEYRRFFMHGTGHFLGLDTHDVGNQQNNGTYRGLQEGMVFTIEPGIYIRPAEDIDKKWWDIGVRIEDNILVTKNGCEVLTAGAPKTVVEIEQLMRLGYRTHSL